MEAASPGSCELWREGECDGKEDSKQLFRQRRGLVVWLKGRGVEPTVGATIVLGGLSAEPCQQRFVQSRMRN